MTITATPRICTVRTDDVINGGLWRIFPVINVDRVKDIPKDYPGAMGVPITIFDKLNPDQFEVLDCISPKIGGRKLYKRVVIRNLKPDLPSEIDLADWMRACGCVLETEAEE